MISDKIKALAVIGFFLPAFLLAQPIGSDFFASVVHVGDGDSIRVTRGRQRIEIRLASIDAPELQQVLGPECKSMLARRVLNQRVVVHPITTDRYRRTVADISIGNENINRYMVRNGCAWAYPVHLHDRQMIGLERLARAEKRGVWQLAARDRVPPWLFRQRSR